MKRKFEPEAVFFFIILLFTLSLGVIFNFKLRDEKERRIKKVLKPPKVKVFEEEEEEEEEEFSISIEEEE
ncbi:MAG: hypothetical protein DRI22_01435 [Caldiserica bacterium]|nr:MAG: hypothetical protein DRI22_01435 [Caldisericota bacterium]